MFDTYVASQLKIWADWRIRREQGGTGFPRKVSFLKVAPQASGYWTPEMDSQAYQMDQCVMALDEILYKAVVASYIHTTTLEQKCNFCDCKERTYRYRLADAHQKLLGLMNDLAAGIPIKTIPKPKHLKISALKIA